MDNIIYKAIYSDKKCLNTITIQEEAISHYLNNNINFNYKIVESKSLKNLSSFDRNIDRVIDSMKEHDDLTVSHINVLGQSMHSILKRLDMLFKKKCSLHIITNHIHIQPNDESEAMKFLFEMFQMSNFYKNQKMKAVKNTLELTGKKTGRVLGKKYKSKFDVYRSIIITMHSKGISKKKICETIGIGTPQAIGKYIKAINEKTNNEKKKDKKRATTYIEKPTIIDSNKVLTEL